MSYDPSDLDIQSELVDTVLPEGGKVVSLVKAFFDESHTHQQAPVMTVAGYVFDTSKAKKFNLSWNAVLAKNNMPYMHMVDFVVGNPPFCHLSDSKRVAIQTKLIELIVEYCFTGIVVSVNHHEYERLIKNDPQHGGVYTLCILICMEAVKQWFCDTAYLGCAAYIFEAGHEYCDQTNDFLNKLATIKRIKEDYKYVGHIFVDKDKSPGVQAADVLAYLFGREACQIADGSFTKRRKDLGSLLKTSCLAKHVSNNELKNFAKMHNHSFNHPRFSG